MYIYYKKFCIGIFMASSFARGCESFHGPYDVWFERKFWIFYWAVTDPNKNFDWGF